MTISRQYAKLELLSCALSCLLLVPETSVRDKQTSAILSSGSHLKVLQQLDQFKEKGTAVPLADKVMGVNPFLVETLNASRCTAEQLADCSGLFH